MTVLSLRPADASDSGSDDDSAPPALDETQERTDRRADARASLVTQAPADAALLGIRHRTESRYLAPDPLCGSTGAARAAELESGTGVFWGN